MATVSEILAALNERIPSALAEEWDNTGHLLGSLEDKVSGVLLSLDVTGKVVKEAERLGCNLIISHHPVIFHGIKAVTAESSETKAIYEILRAGINVISLHTQLDSVMGGVNDCLTKKLGFYKTDVLAENNCFPDAGIGRIGILETPVSIPELAQKIKSILNAPSVQYKNVEKQVQKIAIVSGSGDDYIETAIAKGCDTLITGELKYHTLTADTGINIICSGHFYSEVVGLDFIEEILHSKFTSLKLLNSKEQNQIISYI